MTTNKLPLLILGCATTAISANAATAPQQPNIVMLFADDLGWADLGYVNPQFQTPNIDKLQQEGTYFSRAYVSTATSSPSRASLLTGKEALRCGFTRHIYDDNDEGEFQSFVKDPRQMLSRAWLPSEETTYAERLKETGYHTTHVGKWHLGYEEYFPQTQGFDEVIATAKYGHPKSYYSPFFVEGDPYPDATKED
ncbi:MAG: sulfatase-like hydrolase/transferase, partial [Rikenellaceae bacterium]